MLQIPFAYLIYNHLAVLTYLLPIIYTILSIYSDTISQKYMRPQSLSCSTATCLSASQPQSMTTLWPLRVEG